MSNSGFSLPRGGECKYITPKDGGLDLTFSLRDDVTADLRSMPSPSEENPNRVIGSVFLRFNSDLLSSLTVVQGVSSNHVECPFVLPDGDSRVPVVRVVFSSFEDEQIRTEYDRQPRETVTFVTNTFPLPKFARENFPPELKREEVLAVTASIEQCKPVVYVASSLVHGVLMEAVKRR